MAGEEFAYLSISFVYVALGVAVLIGLSWLTSERKTKAYRKELMDLYVAAKIKFLAQADKLDLVEEHESFKKWAKKRRMEDLDLDDMVEEEIKEKIAEPTKAAKEVKK